MTKQEKRKEYLKRYNEKNKDKIKAYKASYYKKNLDSIKEYNKSNSVKISEWHKTRRLDHTHDPIVYLLEKENYVGTTNRLTYRLNKHKNKYNRDVSEVIILGEFKDRDEALELERALHKEGYKGKHINNRYV